MLEELRLMLESDDCPFHPESGEHALSIVEEIENHLPELQMGQGGVVVIEWGKFKLVVDDTGVIIGEM